MENFIKDDFLLHSDLAKKLYDSVKNLPIVDYHCHLQPKEIAQDQKWQNITQIWLGGDHYKWRLMRQYGIDESLITGNAGDYEKFLAWAQTIESAVGNPLYHWSHLELKNYFGYDGFLNSKTAPEVWEICNKKIQSPDFSAKKLIEKSNVACIGTTDDPIDDLAFHKAIAADKNFSAKVIPTFRPDKLLLAQNAGFAEYVEKLAQVTGKPCNTFEEFCAAIKVRVEYFAQNGCKSSDHSFDEVPFAEFTADEINSIYRKALKGEVLSQSEIEKYQTALMVFLAGEYCAHGWVMQLHFGVVRNTNTVAKNTLGADTGFDRIKGTVDIENLSRFLDCLNSSDALPKTILYSLNPNDNAALDVLAGCFFQTGVKGKVQHGAAWWFNDHQKGMENHLEGLSYSGLLSVFVGMLTDSRSFLSYARHEYFRRILCNFIAEKCAKGEFCSDLDLLTGIAENICYLNAKNYFSL